MYKQLTDEQLETEAFNTAIDLENESLTLSQIKEAEQKLEQLRQEAEDREMDSDFEGWLDDADIGMDNPSPADYEVLKLDDRDNRRLLTKLRIAYREYMADPNSETSSEYEVLLEKVLKVEQSG